jgi:hypothetical protein
MVSLKEQFGTGDRRAALVDDAVKVLDQEVADKGGLTGIAIKGAYKLVQGMRPGFIPHVVDHLLDDFLGALEPIYAEAVEKKRPAGAYLLEQRDRVSDALLSVTDRRAQSAQSATIKSAYSKLRPMAKKQVDSAAPRLASLVDRHAAPTV